MTTLSYREVIDRDLLHIGDAFGVEWKHPTMISRPIVNHQMTFDDLKNKDYARISHVGLITAAECTPGKTCRTSWRSRSPEGVEMWSPQGRIIDLIGPQGMYPVGSGCLLHIFRRQFDNPEDRFRLAIRCAFDANCEYSWGGILSFLGDVSWAFKWIRPVKSHRFCSQLLVRNARLLGIPMCPGQEDWQVTPAEFCDDGAFPYVLSIDTDKE